MGRNIPSISHRLDARIRQWEKFGKHLHGKERQAFMDLISVIKDRRTAIDAADEADLGVAILLALVTHLKGERYDWPSLAGAADDQGNNDH
jgi:hypothetical protein